MFVKNKNWIILSLITVALVFLSFLIQDKLAIKVSVYLGLGFLVLTLVPPNIHKILPVKLQTWNSKLIKFRRDFGIVAGILLVLHGLLSSGIFGKFNLKFALGYNIIGGFLAYLIFIALLLTSSNWSIRVLKKNWKRLHLLVWSAVGLAFSHAVLAKYTFDEKEYPTLAVILILSILLASIIQLFRKKYIQFVLFAAGWVVALVLVLSLNPNAFNNLKYSSESSNNSNNSSLSDVGTITLADLAKHKSKTDCWVSFNKKVYNVTAYLPDHPGGAGELGRYCGKTLDSIANNHPGGNFSSSELQNILKNYLIGSLG
jgi:DMSO/TMAO reductase YedYZ heme-binding membrane subunit